MSALPTLDLRLAAIRYAAPRIHLFEFRAADSATLPEFEPGAHVDVHLPNGLVRAYSLAMPYGSGDRYVLGVKLDAASRGGSRCMHEALRVGQTVRVGRPRNQFPLAPNDGASVFIAGGIGITPIHCMVRHLSEMGRPWTLHYAVRQREEAALFDELARLDGGSVHLHVDESCGQVLDVASIVADAGPGAHLYCCGPAPMLQAFTAATAGLPPSHVHVEHFSADGPDPMSLGGFDVELARTGRRLRIPQGMSIVQVMRHEGLDPPVSCEKGHCGACETRVLSGALEHRDIILTEEEKRSGKTMMICVSGCTSETLVLDL